MSFILALLEKIGLGALSAWLGHKTDVAKEAGADEQALKDQGIAYEETADAAASAADSGQRVREQLPSADTVIPADASIFKDNPDLPTR